MLLPLLPSPCRHNPVETMRRAVSILAASTAATTTGAFNVNVNVNLGLDPNTGGRVATGAARGVSGGNVRVGVTADVAPAAVTGRRSTSYFTGSSRRTLEPSRGSGTRREESSFTMFSSNPAVLQRQRSRIRSGGPLELSSSGSSSGNCGALGAAGLAAASGPFGRAPGLRRRNHTVGRGRLGRSRGGRGGRRTGERGGVALEAYRYLNTYHDGIGDDEREWNKFEEKDYVELGTSGLMVSRVSSDDTLFELLQQYIVFFFFSWVIDFRPLNFSRWWCGTFSQMTNRHSSKCAVDEYRTL